MWHSGLCSAEGNSLQEIRGLLPSVFPPLRFQYHVLTFSADGAAMGPVSSVQSLVGPEAVGVPQRLATVAAEETSPGVGKHVPAEFRFLGETLVTLGAGKRLLSVVNPQMALEVP